MKKANILVVDDNNDTLELLEAILDDAGYEVRTSTSGEMALKSIEKLKPDMILLDIMMPGLNGFEVCEILKKDKLLKNIPIIYLSAKGEIVDKVKGFDLGAIDYITKPFDISEILIRIKTHLSVYMLERELRQKVEIIDKYVISSSTDLNGVITKVSDAFCKISGYTKDELIGKTHRILRHPDMKAEVYSDLWKTIRSGKIWEGEIKNLRKDGSIYYVQSIISPNIDLNGNITGYTSIKQDITDKKRIELLSITDELTGLHNRRHFHHMFPIDIKRAIRYGSHLSFIMLDIDFFKQYNDTYGHQAGDNVLSRLGTTLRNTLQRPEDLVFRLGGEEFGMLFYTDTCESAKSIAQSVCDDVKALKIEHKESTVELVVTISIGIVCIDFSKKSMHNISDHDIYKMADDALYKAKESGRNKVVVSAID